MHKAVDLCSLEEKLNILFPTVEKNKPNRNKRFKLTAGQCVSIYLITIIIYDKLSYTYRIFSGMLMRI